MTRSFMLLCSLAAAPVALNAQAVVRPAGPLGAAHVPVRDAMLVLRDSLMTVNGAAARLQRDFRETSDAALTSHARGIANACARASCGKRNVPAPKTQRRERRMGVIGFDFAGTSQSLRQCSSGQPRAS